ncbi:membrane-associated tyrosine- and threonine-specific cdc2-inhibitory kinase isoform X2 [Chironomus tepperi]|uniref:membrane-associated tyrosine- and threonine-specific cdc2-inhibitory kinase isoform X2 n=1 Tax=Chironomus tepperi TaxID=113505 RepID=UPI00391F173E
MLPVPEILESNLNHSFKFHNRDDYRKIKRPPKLYPKEFSLLLLKNGHREAHGISFKESSSNSSTPKSKNSTAVDLSNSFYDKNKNESYFEQCFDQIKRIGEGSFAEVYKVRSKEDGQYYAIKKMRFIHRGENYRRERLDEVRRYEEFSDNENCMTLYKAWEQDDLLYMQVELCQGSVQDYVEKVKKVPESFIWSFLLDLLLALKSLHDKSLIHLDIKLDNVLLTNDYRCKLADFGLVFDIKNSNRSRAIEGDSRYIAPELLEGNYCLANDIFSLGITLLELASNVELPANGKLWQSLRTGIIPQEISNEMKSLSPELLSIIKSMLEPEPQKRPTVNSLLNMSYLKHLYLKRKMTRMVNKVKQIFLTGLEIIKIYFLFAAFCISDFFRLRGNMPSNANGNIRKSSSFSKKIEINVRHIDENSDDDDSSFKALNNSRVSKLSAADDDNNNESSVTPTLNNSIPRVTPELKIINSTPLNHFNHQHEGLSSRKYRRDLTKSCFGIEDGFCSPVIPRNGSIRNISQDRDSFICSKKLLFKDEDMDDI